MLRPGLRGCRMRDRRQKDQIIVRVRVASWGRQMSQVCRNFVYLSLATVTLLLSTVEPSGIGIFKKTGASGVLRPSGRITLIR